MLGVGGAMYTDTRACLLHLGVELPRVEKTSLASVPFYLARAVVLLPVWFGSFGACGGAYWLCGCCWLCARACCAPRGAVVWLAVVSAGSLGIFHPGEYNN